MNLSIVCSNCNSTVELDAATSVDQLRCPFCNSDIQLRRGRVELGTIIKDRYQTLHKVSDDGYSAYFAALDTKAQNIKLIRVFDKTLTYSLEEPRKFLEITLSMSSIGGTGQLPILESDIDDDFIYQVIPFTKIESLEKLIECGYLWEPLQALDLIYEILLSLDEAYISSKIGHFSLNPRNIFINEKGDVLYNDFGAATHLLQDKRFVKSQMEVFDIFYISPEITYSENFPKEASDIYSLGMILYHLITGITPHNNAGRFDPGDLMLPRRVENELDESFLFILKNISNREPKRRMHSYRQVMKMIENYFDEIGHSRMKQMSGEKSEIYSKQTYLSNVAPLISSQSSSGATTYNSKPLSSETIHNRIKTSTEIGIDPEFQKKIQDPNRVTRARIDTGVEVKSLKTNVPVKNEKKETQKNKINPNSSGQRKNQRPKKAPGRKKAPASVIAHKRRPSSPKSDKNKKKSSSGLLVSVLFLFLVGSAIGLYFYMNRNLPEQEIIEKIESNKESKVKELTDTEEADSSLADDKLLANKEKLEETEKKIIKVDRDWYLRALGEAEPNFKAIDEKFLFDKQHAAESEKNTLDFISNEISESKNNLTRRIIIELKSEVNTLMFQKKYIDALAVYENYDGPFKEESLVLRKSLIDELKKSIQNNIGQEDSAPLSLEELEAHQVTEVSELLAQSIIDLKKDLVDKYSQNLSSNEGYENLPEIIQVMDHNLLDNNLLKNLAKSDTVLFDLEINNKKLQSRILSCDLDNKSIQISSFYQGRELKQSVKLSDFNFKQRVDHLIFDDENKTHFARFTYALFKDNFPIALKELRSYSGPLSEDLVNIAQQKLDFMLEEKINKLLLLFNYDPDKPDNISNDDAIVLNKLLKSLKVQFSESNFLIEDAERLEKIDLALRSKSRALSSKDIFLGPDSQKAYPKFSKHTFKNNTVIRLLPGSYSTQILVNANRVRVIGCSGVKIEKPIVIKGSYVSISSVQIAEGDIIVEEDSSNLSLTSCFLPEGGIQIQGDVSGIDVSNCLLRYIKGNNESEKLDIVNTTIVQMENYNQSLISGISKSSIINSVIHSGKVRLFSEDRRKLSIKLKLCLLSCTGSLAKVNNTELYTLDELDDNFDSVKNCLLDKAEFKSISNNIFSLKDFSPGFKSGQGGNSIGANFDDYGNLKALEN